MSWLIKVLWDRASQRPPKSWDEWMVLARSHDGFVREAAVEALGLSGHGPALPVLLERVNDWVPQVRLVAQRAVESFLVEEQLASWAHALGSFVALRRAARADHSRLLAAVDGFLSQPGSINALKAAVASMPREAARYVFTLEMQHAADEATRTAVLAEAVKASDVVVAAQAVAAVATLAQPALRLQLALEACRSGFAPVRAAGLRIVLASASAEAVAQAQAMCWDRSASVRALAIGGLPPGGGPLVDAARQALQGGAGAKARVAALDLLCRLVPGEALDLCQRAASDASVWVRCSAFARQFALLGGEARDALVSVALKDASPKLRHLACVQIRKGASPPAATELLAICGANPGAVGHVIQAASRHTPWVRLEILVSALKVVAADAQGVRLVHDELAAWSSEMQVRCFVSPTKQQTVGIARLWAGVRDNLPAPLQRRLAPHLQAFGILPA